MKKESLNENLHGMSVSVLAFFVAAWATVSVAAPSIWTGGKDTTWYAESAQAFNLTTAEELAGLAYLVNNGTTFQGKTITLGADIFLNDTTGAGKGTWSTSGKRMWTPIGTQSNPFKGEFDGLAGKKNRKIYGLYINDTTKSYVAFFGSVFGAEISNIDFIVGMVAGDSCVGTLSGCVYKSTKINNIHSEVNAAGKKYVGGIVGANLGYLEKDDYLQISNSSATLSVFGYDYVGGIAGSAAKIENSFFYGLVEGHSYVGGIVGVIRSVVNANQLTKSLTNCNSEAIVLGKGDYVGGVVGNGGSIEKTFFKGRVKGESYVGGVAGKINSISKSYSEGNVEGDSSYVGGVVGHISGGGYVDSVYHIGGDVSGYNYVGGVAGRVWGDVSVFSSNANVRGVSFVGGLIGELSGGISNSYVNGNVIATADYAGGLIGLHSSYDKISKSHSVGNVDGNFFVGGLVGKSSGTSIVKSYSEGTVRGVLEVGGLVGSIRDTSNITVVDSCFHQNGDVVGQNNYVGGLLGFATKVTVSNSKYINGNVEGFNYVGGLIGKDSLYGFIDNSISESNVEGYNYVGGVIGQTISSIRKTHHKGSILGLEYVGGIAGHTSAGISNSFSNGKVTGISKLGGLVGYSNNNIDSSFSLGEVYGRSSNSISEYVGGLVGYLSGKISNSFAIEKVRGQNNVGGLAGLASSVANSYFIGDSVTGAYHVGGLIGVAKGKVDSSYSTANVKGDDNVGGLIGSSYGNISYSYATGDVIGDVDNSSAGNDNLGGLVGYAYKGSISKSLATGDVNGTTKLGGLVGRFDGTSISQSYAQGNVTGSYYGNPSDEVGNFYIGGLVGYGKGLVSETYVSGSVKGIEDGPVYTGCIVGYVNGSMEITDSYFDSEKCNLAFEGKTGIATISNSPAQTTDAMQSSSTYGNWDFIDTWRIIGESYPRLSWFAGSLAEVVVKTASLEGFVYDGNEKMPAVNSVMLYETALDEGTDYTISYQNNVNAGTAIINICGIGAYSGCKLVSFEISPVNVAVSIAAIDNQVYSGDSIAPNISVLVADTVISPIDYRLIYTNNINAGKGSVQVVLTGNYSGFAKADFIIEKAPSTILELPTAKDVYFGQTLADAIIEGGDANVEGSFVWSESDVIPDVVNKGYEITFVPADAQNHLTATAIIPLTVQRNIIVFTYGKDTLQVDTLLYGELPQYDGKLPEKESAEYVYTFKGWSPEIYAVEGNAQYQAVFDSTVKTRIVDVRFTQSVSVVAINRNILISAAPVGSAYAIFDMQGRMLKKGRIELGDFSVVAPGAGSYFVQIGKKLERINVK